MKRLFFILTLLIHFSCTDGFVISGKISAKSETFCPEYQNVITYAQNNGIDVPPDSILSIDNAAVSAAVQSGLFSKLDLLYITINKDGYRDYAKLNIKSPGNFTLVEEGTLKFDNKGFTGLPGAYLKTGYTASIHAVNYTLNSSGVYVYCSAPVASAAKSLFGARSTSNSKRLELIPRNTGSTMNYCINSTTSTSLSGGIIWTEGGWLLNRSASNAIRTGLDNNVASISSQASTSVPVTELYLLACNNNGTAINTGDLNIGVFALGSSLLSHEAELNGLFNPRMQNQAIPSSGSAYVISMDGQSNSEGISLVSTLPDSMNRTFKNVFIYSNPNEKSTWGRWERLKAGLNNQQGASRLVYYGAEIAIADLFERNHPNDVLYIIKMAVGNSAVSNTINPNWAPATAAGCYPRALNFFHIPARASLPSGVIDKGLIWMQGEEDANKVGTADTTVFRNNTLAVFNAFRTNLSLPNLPILVCRVNSSIARDPVFKANVRYVQGTSSGQLCDPILHPNNTHFSTDAYTLIDPVHLPQIPFGTDLYHVFFP